MRTAVILSIVLPWAVATPVLHSHQAAFQHANTHEEPTTNTEDAMVLLLDRYAPIIKLSIVEQYFPSSIEYMLPHFDHIQYENGVQTPANQTLLTPSKLNRLPPSYLSIPESHNPQPILLDPSAEYLFGPAGQEGEMKRDDDGRGLVEEPIYGFWVDQGRGIVDLWYWTFYPFNFGKPVGAFGILGNHVGDWERLRVRTINGSAESADYHSHAGGGFTAGTVRWSDVPKLDDRPVGFCAAGSHGLWPTPGNHVYADLVNLFKLVDVTDDQGPIWDTKGHVVPFQYWDGTGRRRKVYHHGEESWVDFRGHWGNRGESDCWWFKLVGICQLVGAPPGPNRFFGGPPDCIVGPISEGSSSFSFYFGNPVVQDAEQRGISQVRVEQICARPRRREDDGDDDPDDGMTPTHDDREEEDLETWAISGMTEFVGHELHTVTTPACGGMKSAVKSYRISLCIGDGQCLSTSDERKICSFEEGKKGYRLGNAVSIEDVDDWLWAL